MAGGVHDVLFRLIGDPDDAERALKEVAAELEAFARISAEAKADLDTTGANARLEELKAKLDDLDASHSSPEISTDILGVMGQLEALQAELRRIDGEDVTVDINMRKDILDRIQSLTSQTNLLARATHLASDEGASFASRIGGTAVSMGPFTTQLRTAVPLVLALLGAIVSLIGAVAAMAASLVEAAAGLGALAIAFGGVLLPSIGLAIGVIKDFKANADQAGTAANRLKTALSDFGKSFNFAPAIHVVEGALADLLTRAKGLGTVISPAFASFARSAADGIKAFGNVVLQPAAIRSFAAVIQQAGGAMRPLAQIAGQVFRIFTNIANAAMPLLVSGLQSVATAAKGLADQTSNIGRLRGIIGALVGQLQTWLQLTGAISRVFLGFVRAAAGPGQQFVKFLTDGANALADWVNSAEGQQRIKQFFSDTLPLAEQLVGVIAKLAVILIQLGEVFAPVLTPIAKGFNDVLSVLIGLLEIVNKVPAPIRAIVGTLLSLVLGFGTASVGVRLLIASLGVLAGIGAGVFRAIAGAAAAAFGAVIGGARRLGTILRTVWQGLGAAARVAWAAVRAIVTGILGAIIGNVRARFQAIVAVARAAWSAVRTVVGTALRAALAIVRAVLGAMRGVVSAGFQAILSIARAVLSALRTAVSTAFHAAVAAVRAALGAMRTAASAVFHAVVDSARSVLAALKGIVSGIFSGLASAISGATGALVSAASSVWNAIKDAMSGVIHVAVSIDAPGIVKKLVPGIQHGTHFAEGGWALVGEAGPELVKMPRGAQVLDNSETQSKLGGVVQHFHVSAPQAQPPDPVAVMAKLALITRMRGGRL